MSKVSHASCTTRGQLSTSEGGACHEAGSPVVSVSKTMYMTTSPRRHRISAPVLNSPRIGIGGPSRLHRLVRPSDDRELRIQQRPNLLQHGLVRGPGTLV